MTNRTYKHQSQHQRLLTEYFHFISPQQPSAHLEQQFQTLCSRVRSLINMHHWSKHVKVRTEAWLDRLHRENYNPLEQQNRVNYLKMLHLMLECEHLVPPFHACPPSTTLPLLDKHKYRTICQEMNTELRSIRSQRMKSLLYSPTASPNKKINRNTSFGSTMTRGKNSCQDLGHRYQLNKKACMVRQKNRSNMMSNLKDDTFDSIRLQKNTFKGRPFERSIDTNVKSFHLKSLHAGRSYQGLDDARFVQQDILGSEELVQARPQSVYSNVSEKCFAKPFESKLQQRVKAPWQGQVREDGAMKPLDTNLMAFRFKYWQTSSNVQNETPKYLNGFTSFPYTSLVLSEEDNLLTHRSRQQQQCFCLPNFLSKINHR